MADSNGKLAARWYDDLDTLLQNVARKSSIWHKAKKGLGCMADRANFKTNTYMDISHSNYVSLKLCMHKVNKLSLFCTSGL